nr:immunoglobulin heavy chain junction region [Mus musculus]MBK4186004.1 immunoglobulin heavy chain junction region [Mus musculus]
CARSDWDNWYFDVW